MTDDRDVQEKATRRFDAVGRNKEAKQIRVQQDSAEAKTVREVPVSPSADADHSRPLASDTEPIRNRYDSSQWKTVRREAITGPAEDDDPTTMIDREELMQKTARDQERGENLQSKATLRMETPFPSRYDTPRAQPEKKDLQADESHLDQTHEMKIMEQTTRPVVPTDHILAVDGTEELACHGIISDDNEAATFPARVDNQLSIVIPPKVLMEADLSPGDLVVVKIEKVD